MQDTVDKADLPEIMDFFDERNEHNPLVYKNPQLRAEVAEMNAAILKALPSLKDFDSSNEPCTVMTREEMVAEFYRNKPSFLERKPSGRIMTKDDIEFFTPPADLDEVLDAKLGTDFVRRKKEKQDAELKPSVKRNSSPAKLSLDKNEAEYNGFKFYAENTAARGDCFETDQPLVKSITIDLRPPKPLLEVESSNNETKDEVTKTKLDAQSPSNDKEKGEMENSTTSIRSKEGFVDGGDASDRENGETSVGSDVPPSTMPRGCCLKDGGEPVRVEYEDVDPHLLREIFEIRAGKARAVKVRSTVATLLPRSASSESESDRITKDVAENAADAFETNKRLADVWDWVTAIPRSYYAEEDFRILKVVFRSSSFYSNTKECSLDSRTSPPGNESKILRDEQMPQLPSSKYKQKENCKVVNEPSSILLPSKPTAAKIGVKKRVEPLNEIDPNVFHSRDPNIPNSQSDPPNKF